MKRRDFLKLASSAGLASALPVAMKQAHADNLHTGTILMTFHMGGGWDHSSFSDPRENPSINRWANNSPAGTAGNLRYAPFAENAAFYEKYHQQMLVINGIDNQTNGHDAATRHRNTGNLMEGFPSLNELYGASVAPTVPMSFVRAGGFSGSVGILPFTNMPDENLLRTLTNPNFGSRGMPVYEPSHMEALRKYQSERLDTQVADKTNMPRWAAKLEELKQARAGSGTVQALSDAIPDSFDTTDLAGTNRREVRNSHMFLVLASAGLTSTGSFSLGGFDTHGDHDNRHTTALTRMTRVIDYTWAKAEEMGLADRLLMHITSDVGRTPHYNANNGKDHWSVGSDIIMMKNMPWTNRMIGATGPRHERIRINPTTLQVDENGIHLRPKHVHQAMRQLLGIDQNAFSQRYNLDAEALPIFDASVSTGIQV